MMGVNFTVDTVVPYLVNQQMVSADAIVAGDLEVVDAGRRNQNLKVIRRDGPSYLIKQPGEGERGTLATLRAEAAFYRHCFSGSGLEQMRGILPRFHGCDAERDLLTLELIEGRPLWDRNADVPPAESLAGCAKELGEAVGTLHRLFREPVSCRATSMSELHADPPWILGVHRPAPEAFASISPANLQVLKMLQQNAPITAGLDRLSAGWTADTVIHNDLKGDNVLISSAGDERPQVRLVDWEMVQVGDGAWDVGSMLRDFLGYWLLSVPLTADLTPEQMLEGCTWPLASMHPAARAFWDGYRASACLDSAIAGEFLQRSVCFAAARLVQAAYELSLTSQQPSNLAIAMLQLAANILADPQEASLHLFGIPVPWRPAGHAPSAS